MSIECVTSVTDDSFAVEVLNHAGTVLVDFFTPWCPPCRKVAPVMEELCAESHGALKVVKIDASENIDSANLHRVSAVPAFALYRSGKLVAQTTGYQSKAQFSKWIASNV